VLADEAQPLERRPLARLMDGAIGPDGASQASRYSTSIGSL
jgi:hypothetical protein